ncbi:MFS transporter [Halobacteriaceae archaeon GCM10025711]
MPWDRRYSLLVLLMASFFASMTARLSISPVVPDVIGAFDVSKGAIGLAMTAMWAAYALTQFPGTLLSERVGARRVILLALTLTALGSVALSFTPSYPAFVVLVVLLGAGSGLYLPTAMALLTRKFTNTGQVLGLHYSGGDLAGLFAPVAAVTLALQFEWRVALLLGAVVAIPPLVAGFFFLPGPVETDGDGVRPEYDLAGLLGLLARPRVAYTTLLAVVTAFAFQALVTFFPTFLIEYWQLPAGEASTLFSGVFLLWILFMPVSGRVADATSYDAVLVATLGSMALGMGLLVTVDAFRWALVGVVLLGVGMSWGGVLSARFMANLPDAGRTTGYGLARTVFTLLGSAGNVVVGVLATRAGWPVAYGLVAALLGFAVLTLVVNRTFRLGF